MDPVSKLARALGIGRTAAAARTGTKGRAAPQRSAGSAQQPPLAQLAARIRALPPDAPGAREAGVHAVLEHMLAREFGAEAVAGAALQQTVRDVQRVMESDAAMRAEMDRLLEQLRRP
jgi:hypothetical protein